MSDDFEWHWEKTIKEQRAEIERLREMLDNRNEFIAQKGLWKELGQYLAEPHERTPDPA